MTAGGDSKATDDERNEGENEADANGGEPHPDDGTDHLNDIEDGVGCTEIWERLSEKRES